MFKMLVGMLWTVNLFRNLANPENIEKLPIILLNIYFYDNITINNFYLPRCQLSEYVALKQSAY